MMNLQFLFFSIMLFFSISLKSQAVVKAAKESSSNQYSNNKIATSPEELIDTELFKKITGKEKTNQDIVIALKSDGEISAYDLKTLKNTWNLKFSDSSYNKMRNHFNIENSVLYTSSTQKEILAVNVNDGTPYWKVQLGIHKEIKKRYEINGQHLPIKDNLIFIASNNKHIYAFDKRDGNFIWNYQLQFPFNNYSPVINKDHLIISNAPWVYCFEAKTGKPLWQRGFGNIPMYSQLQIDEENVYVASERSKIYALKIGDNAAINWEIETAQKSPSINENTLLDKGIYYYGAENQSENAPSVVALDIKMGKQLWTLDLKNKGDEIKIFQKHKDYIVGFTNATENSFFVLDAVSGKQLEVPQPKETAISNIFLLDDQFTFLTANYLVSYNVLTKVFDYKNLKLDFKVNDAFPLYFEIVKASK